MNATDQSTRIAGWLAVSACALFVADSLSLTAQGLSGVPRRLEETVGVSFSGKVAGVLSSRCGKCHVNGSKGDFRMSSFAELMRAQGVVKPGDSAKSKLFAMVDSDEMPPKGSIPQDEKDIIKRWIDQGAKFDGSNENSNLSSLASGGGAPARGAGAGSGGGPPAGYGGSGPPAGYGGGDEGSGDGGYGAGMAGYATGPPEGYGGEEEGSGDGGYGAGMAGYATGPPEGYGGGDGGYGDEGGYGASMGGYGGGPAASRGRATGTPSADAMETYASSLTSMLGSMDVSGLFGPDQEINVESGPILKNDAEQAFMAGNLPLASELMFGHMTTEYRDALVALQTVKYSRLLKRPVWSIRWGVSISIRGDGISDPSPIKEGATPLGRIASRGGGGRRGGDFGGGQDYGGEGQDYGGGGYEEQGMEDYGGEMENYGGQMQAQMQGQGQMGPTGRAPGAGGGPQRPAAPKIPERKMLSDEAKELLSKNLGLVVEVIGEEFDKRFQRGDFGPVFATLTQSPEIEDGERNAPAIQLTPSGSMSAALNETLLDAGEPANGMWHPGIVFLGEGFSEEILAMAKAANLDLVLHFDVVLKEGREDAVQNISRCRLLQVSPPKDSQGRVRHQVVTSKGMDSNEASQFAAAGRMDEREYVTEKLSGLFTVIDREVKVIDLPTLPAAVAQGRIAKIISGPHAKSLRTLAEIRLFQAKELISESEVETAFDIVGGTDGLILLHGPQRERVETARRWAVEAAAAVQPQ